MSLNTDTSGLEDVLKPHLGKIRTSYHNAYTAINNIALPSEFEWGFYKTSASNSLSIVVSNMTAIMVDIDKYIADLKAANGQTSATVASVPSTSFSFADIFGTAWEGLFSAGTYSRESAENQRKALAFAAETVSGDVFGTVKDAYSTYWSSLLGGAKTAIGTSMNVVLAPVNGIANFQEAAVDTGLNVWAAYQEWVTKYITAPFVSLFNQELAEAVLDYAETKRKETMEYVEEDTTDKKWDNFYGLEGIQDLNDGALIEYEGVIYEFVEALGEWIPVKVADASLAGAGTVLAGIGGMGQSIEETYDYFENSSKAGMKEAHEEGKISDEDYALCEKIWNMTDSEYEAYVIQHLKENFSTTQLLTNDGTLEEKARLDSIRNMPGEWTTKSNFDKAQKIGAAEGAIAAAQWEIDKVLNALGEGKTSFVTSSARILGDTAANATDVPVRAIIDSAVLGISYDEAYDKRGGTAAVVASAAFGLLGSGLGEIFDFVGSKKKNTGVDLPDLPEGTYGDTTLEKVDVVDDADVKTEVVDMSGVFDDADVKTEAVDMAGFFMENTEELKYNIAYELIVNYCSKHEQLGINKEQVEEIFKKIKIYDDYEFDSIVIADGANRLGVKDIKGYALEDGSEIMLRQSTGVVEIIHEVNHLLGGMLSSDGAAHASGYHGIQEIFTQRFASKMFFGNDDLLYDGNGVKIDYDSSDWRYGVIKDFQEGNEYTDQKGSAYTGMLKPLDDLLKSLESVGFKDLDTLSYFNGSENRSAFQDALTQVTGDENFYRDLSANFSKYNTMEYRVEGFINVTAMIDEVIKLCEGMKK